MSLRNNTLHNLLGGIAPTVVALVTIPLLLAKIGDVRFGVLALVWLLLGHFGVFDFGLSRATANRIARLPKDDVGGRRAVFWTSLWMNLFFGALGAVCLYAVAEPLMVHVFKVGAATRVEVLIALGWVAAAVPLATVTGVLGGALDGVERFDVANTLQALGAMIVQVAPVVAAYTVSSELDVLIPASVLGRLSGVLLLFVANLRIVAPGPPLPADRQRVRELFGFGAWISVSALIVPFFLTLDKFMIGATLGAAAVTYYSVPDQLVRRISVLPVALGRSMFSRISAVDSSNSVELSLRSSRVLTSALTPLVALLITAMHPFLSLWITPEFAKVATGPGILLAAGIWLSSLAMIPSVYLQASGRPDVPAKCHLLEILPHVAILWLCVRYFGAIGAAAAMLAVTILDAVLLMVFARMRLWRMGYFWQAAAWIAASGAIGSGDYSIAAWRYGAAVAVVAAAAVWAVRTAPELAGMAAAFLRRVPVSGRRDVR